MVDPFARLHHDCPSGSPERPAEATRAPPESATNRQHGSESFDPSSYSTPNTQYSGNMHNQTFSGNLHPQVFDAQGFACGPSPHESEKFASASTPSNGPEATFHSVECTFGPEATSRLHRRSSPLIARIAAHRRSLLASYRQSHRHWSHRSYRRTSPRVAPIDEHRSHSPAHRIVPHRIASHDRIAQPASHCSQSHRIVLHRIASHCISRIAHLASPFIARIAVHRSLAAHRLNRSALLASTRIARTDAHRRASLASPSIDRSPFIAAHRRLAIRL